MKLLISILGIFVLAGFILFSCAKDKTAIDPFADLDCSSGTVFFANDVMPIIEQNCSTTDCHDAMTGAGGYEFINHESIAGNADKIYKTMRHEPGVLSMPQNLPKLADSLIQKFGCWLSQGKLNN